MFVYFIYEHIFIYELTFFFVRKSQASQLMVPLKAFGVPYCYLMP